MSRGKRKAWQLAFLASGLLSIVFFIGKPVTAEPAEPAALEEAWTDLEHLSLESTSGAYAPVLKIAPDRTIMVLYNHEVEGGGVTSYAPHFRRSRDGGKTWTGGTVYSGSESSAHVDFAFDSNSRAHAVWRTPSGLWYAAQGDWPTTGTLIAPSNGRRIDNPAIAVADDGTIFVVWLQAVSKDNNAQDVYYRYLPPGIQSWTTAPPFKALTTAGDSSGSAAPDVAFDASGNVHVLWEESFAQWGDLVFRNEVFYLKGTRSSTGTYQWSSEPQILSDSHPGDPGKDISTSSFRPAIVAAGNNLHVVYEDRETAGEQDDQANANIAPYYVGYTAGVGWQPPTDISGSEPFYVNTRLPFYLGTSVAACDSNVYVYFHGSYSLNSPELVWGIEYANGSWSKAMAVTTESARHTNPALDCRGNTVHLAFERILNSAVNHQIYFAANTANEIFMPILFRLR